MPTGGSNIEASIRRPCAAARFGSQAPGHAYLKVPFARCSDGVARHVTAVSVLDSGPFQCLDCEERLTLRRPRAKRAHFAHRPDSLCTGETALHRYAKELLHRTRTLALPTLVLREDGVSVTVFEAGTYTFEQVRLEVDLGAFRPDAVVTYKGSELAVEFLVSHAVDGEKRSRVLERDLSMVEVDLSSVRAGQLSAEELDGAILRVAPRSWVYHRRRAAAAEKLAAQVATKRTERGRRLKWHIEKTVRAAVPEGWADEARRAVEAARLDHLIDLPVDCEHWFAVPRSVWQAEILKVYVLDPAQTYSPGGRDLKLKGAWPHEHSLASKIPDWMIRTDLSSYPAKRLSEAGFDQTTYGSPDHGVWSYLGALHLRNEAVFWNREEQAFFVDPDLHGTLYRRVELPRLVSKLLTAAGHVHAERRFDSWSRRYEIEGYTPAALVETGGDGYRALLRRLQALEAMLSSYRRQVVDDLCGLPLESLRQRVIDAIAAEDAEKARKAQEAVDARQRSISIQAQQMLGSDATAWLSRSAEDGDRSISEFAGTTDDALYKAERWLAQAADERRRAAAAAERVAAARAELTRAAQQAYPDPRMAELFLNTSHPRIRGMRPIEYCQSDETLRILKSLPPAKR